jgi:hypothetical protein
MDPPFDGKSELVTTNDCSELLEALLDFVKDNDRFNAFMEKAIMEKYVGPLDGKNIKRNFDFIAMNLCKVNTRVE